MSRVVESVVVNVPATAAYGQWLLLSDLPKILTAVKAVEEREDGISHWTVDVAGVTREFDAVTLRKEPDRLLSWTSLDGPKHSGTIEFNPIDEMVTEVTADVHIAPEGLMETIADRLGVVNAKIKHELERFKAHMERPT